MPKIYHCAVLGDPISHSLSPVLHNAAYKALGLTNWQYSKEKVSEAELADFIAHLDDSWKGLSLTMPLKKTVMKLGTPCDYWSQTLKVANTAIFTSNPATASPSQIELCNTDVSGIIRAFVVALHERISQVKKAVIIGSGNTASSAMAALIEIAQASKLEQVKVIARTEDNGSVKGVERFNNLLQKYCTDFPNSRSIEPCLESSVTESSVTESSVTESSETESSVTESSETDAKYESVQGIEFPTLSEEVFECDESLILQSLSSLDAIRAIAEADIVISTVPAHVADGLAIALKAYCQNRCVKSLGTLLDVVYDPRPSMLLSAFRQYGLGIGGEEMLLYQALEQVKLMTFEYRNSKVKSEVSSEASSEEKSEEKSENSFENASDKTADYDNSKDCEYLTNCMRKALQEAL
ncbi:shikimate dehydrogenase family protein [Gardnerella sp. DNF01141]|uniref:shikimate dehydrogenase family protein n=1 Tax=Gardnerella sp. DNF01141 TaxID=2749057 RepID=UPI003BA9599A